MFLELTNYPNYCAGIQLVVAINLLLHLAILDLSMCNWPASWLMINQFMQVEVNVKCMCTKFGGPGLSAFRNFAPFKIWPNSISDHGLWVKNRIE